MTLLRAFVVTLLALACSGSAHAQVALGKYGRLRLQTAHTVPPSGFINVWCKTSDSTCYQTDSSGTDTALGGGGGIGGSIASTQIAVGSGTDTIGGSAKFKWTDTGGADGTLEMGTGPQLTLRTASGSGYSSVESGSTQLRLISGGTVILGSSVASIWPLGTTTVGIDAGEMAGMYLKKVAAPSTPGTSGAWVIYVDTGDGNKLKAKASTGTVVTLGTP